MNKLEKYKDFDFIKFTWFDTNGAARCRVITRRALEWILDTGIGISAVFAKFGVKSTSCKFSKMLHTPINFSRFLDRGSVCGF